MKDYIKKFRFLDIHTRKNISSGFLWDFKSSFKGTGLTFSEFKLREEWSDSSRIDWLVSAREWKIYTREMEEERELSILFLIDVSKNMEFGFTKTKREILLELFFIVTQSWLQNNNKVWAFIFGWDHLEFVEFSKDREQVFQIFTTIENYKNDMRKTDIHDCLKNIENMKLRKKLVFILTDTFDIVDTPFKKFCHQNEVIFCHVFHSFENTLELPDIWDLTLSLSWVGSLNIDLQNQKKKSEFCLLRQEKLKNFSRKILSFWADYLYFDEKKEVFSTLLWFMKKRNTKVSWISY